MKIRNYHPSYSGGESEFLSSNNQTLHNLTSRPIHVRPNWAWIGLIEAQLYRPKSSDILNANLDQNYLEKWKGYIFLFCCDIGGYPQVVSLGCKFAVSKGHVGRIQSERLLSTWEHSSQLFWLPAWHVFKHRWDWLEA